MSDEEFATDGAETIDAVVPLTLAAVVPAASTTRLWLGVHGEVVDTRSCDLAATLFARCADARAGPIGVRSPADGHPEVPKRPNELESFAE